MIITIAILKFYSLAADVDCAYRSGMEVMKQGHNPWMET